MIMTQVAENFQNIVLEDIKKHPELITGMLFDDHDISLILEKRGNTVRYAYLKTYDKDSRRILEEARSEYVRKKKEGYTREQAFDDLIEVQEEITAQLEASEQ
jgi:hypothetical protein